MNIAAVEPHGHPVMGLGGLLYLGLGCQKVYNAWTSLPTLEDSKKILSDRITSVAFLTGSIAFTATWIIGRMGYALVLNRLPILAIIEAVTFTPYYVSSLDDASQKIGTSDADKSFFDSKYQANLRKLITGIVWSVFYTLSMASLAVTSPALVASMNLAATVGLAVFAVDLACMGYDSIFAEQYDPVAV
ncbi:MAG: hypothetical protein P0S94_01000 [Simkaniaceae bacterium]|nr:hypothetical protein [Simkaniaceae bacterium]